MELNDLPPPFREATETRQCLSCEVELASAFLTLDRRPELFRRRPTQVLFCSGSCKDLSAAVRYARATARDGRFNQPDVREQVALKLGLATSGTHSTQSRFLPQAVRAVVLERDGHACVRCGRTNSLEIDHIARLDGPALNSPENLQILCHDCHEEKTRTSAIAIDAEHALRMRLAIELRVWPVEPVVLADDDVWWSRAYPVLARARWLRVIE